jgi:uncharacterized membrane protein
MTAALALLASAGRFVGASGGNTAFFVIFGIFIVAMLVLVVIVIVWAVRHDVAGRREWRERQEARVQWDDEPEDTPS